MKSHRSYLDAFRLEGKDERTDRVARSLVREATEERMEKCRTLRQARAERDAVTTPEKTRSRAGGKKENN